MLSINDCFILLTFHIINLYQNYLGVKVQNYWLQYA